MITHVNATYTDIYTWENLYAAYRKAAKGKRFHCMQGVCSLPMTGLRRGWSRPDLLSIGEEQ